MSDMELSMTGEEDNLNEEYNREHVKEVRSLLYKNQGKNTKEPGGTISERREYEHQKMIDITRDKPVKVTVKVVVPVRDHPKFNFVGKLLGPQGNSLKRLQEDTMTKMAILGRGSMRDKHKEEELRLSGDPKFSHLHDDLHVEITAFAPPAEAHARIAYALTDVRRFLVPDYNDDIRQEQMWEMQILKERSTNSSLLNDELGIHLLGTTIPLVPTATETLSPTNSNRSQSPHTPPSTVLEQTESSSSLPLSLPPSRGSAQLHSSLPVVTPTSRTIAGRKRPLFINKTKHSIGPTKRTVMGILACARASQAKEIPGYHVSG